VNPGLSRPGLFSCRPYGTFRGGGDVFCGSGSFGAGYEVHSLLTEAGGTPYNPVGVLMIGANAVRFSESRRSVRQCPLSGSDVGYHRVDMRGQCALALFQEVREVRQEEWYRDVRLQALRDGVP